MSEKETSCSNGEKKGILLSASQLPLQTQSQKCVQCFDEYINQVLSYGADQRVAVHSVEADPDCVAANVIAAAYSIQKTRGGPVAGRYLSKARDLVGQGRGTSYEHKLLESIGAWTSRDEKIIVDTFLELVKAWPTDLLSVKRGQTLAFYLGREDVMLQLAELASSANSGAKFLDGMLAFALLESARYSDAEVAARRGLSLSSADVWAQHALCHVLYQQCRFQELLELVDLWQVHWEDKSPFMSIHSWWHVALCHLDKGDSADVITVRTVLGIYDDHIWGKDSSGLEDCLNGLGLLLRLQLRGHDREVRDRVSQMISRLESKPMWHLEKLLDLFAIWALSYSSANDSPPPAPPSRSLPTTPKGSSNRVTREDLSLHVKECKRDTSKELLSSMGGVVERTSGARKHRLEVGWLRLAQGLRSFGRGECERACEELAKVDWKELKAVGASEEQLDVFFELQCVALLQAGKAEAATPLLDARHRARPGVLFTQDLLASARQTVRRRQSATGARRRASDPAIVVRKSVT